MSKHTNEITFTRGDTAKFHFHRVDADGEIITTKADRLYFSVKHKPQDYNVVFQKTIDDMEFDEDFEYHFTIEPTDTNLMKFPCTYYYDLEVIDGGVKTTIAYGQFILQPEVTHYNNEGES